MGKNDETGLIASAKKWARAIKRDVVAVWLAASDARTPLAARILAGAVAAYALSPIDLIPDFIPVLGYLDDLLLVPLGILAVIKLIPAPLFAEFRHNAAAIADRPVSWGLAAIICIWALLALSAIMVWTDLV